MTRTVLSPAGPLFREARYLLAEDPGLRDPTLYHSVLAAVAEGNTTRGGIANYIGRKATDLQHPLTVLEDAGLLARDADPLRAGRSNYRIIEPLVAFYQAIMRPSWTRLEPSSRQPRRWVGSRPPSAMVLSMTLQGGRATRWTSWASAIRVLGHHLDRLRHIRALLEHRPGIEAAGARLLCASGAGFTPELRAAADADQVILLDLDRLYRPE